jgi:hypothetical protein
MRADKEKRTRPALDPFVPTSLALQSDGRNATIGWGLFISADPNDFVTQFMGNVRESGTHNGLHRFPLTDAIAGFITEIREGYLGRYGLLEGPGSLNRLKAIVFVIYLSAIAIATTTTPSHRSQTPVRFLLLMTLIVFLVLAFVAGNKWYRY